jgi:hypothetical protein
MTKPSELKGGMETRKLSKRFNDNFQAIKKECGCMFGEKCDCKPKID